MGGCEWCLRGLERFKQWESFGDGGEVGDFGQKGGGKIQAGNITEDELWIGG